MANADILQKIKEIEDLPALPAVVSKILEVSASEDTTAKDLSNVISQDQALTGKTLKLVNSAYYGFPRTVGRITEAVVILGFNAIKNLALSVSVCDFFSGGREGFNRQQLWEHSVGVAVAATMVAKRTKTKTSLEDLFVSGLLHDIGLIIEDRYFHAQFLQVLEQAESEKLPIEKVEKELLGVDHAMIGKKIGEIWKLPAQMSNIIGFHHQPQYADPEIKKETSVVYVADLICKLNKFGFDGDQVIPKLRKEPFNLLGIGKEDLKDMAGGFSGEVDKAQDFLNLIRV